MHDARLPIESPHFGKVQLEHGVAGDDAGEDGEAEDSNDNEEEGTSISQPKYHILDVGSGTGRWAVEAALRYPSADILSLDMTSALLPKDVPANLTFEIRDVAEPWPPQLYDFIHVRNLVGGGVRDWEWLLAQCLSHLKPGGVLEFSEIRPRFYDVDPSQAGLPAGETPVIGGACLEYMRLFAEMCAKEGIDFDPSPRAADYLMTSGAEMVRERVDWLPVKEWGNDTIMRKKGQVLNDMIDVGLENWTLMLFGKSGRNETETRELLKRVMKEVRDPRTRSYFNL